MKNKKIVRITALAALLLLGIGILLYPIVSSAYREAHQGEIITQYREQLEQQDTAERDAVWQAAVDYNKKLYAGAFNLLTPEENGYFAQLLLPGNAMMGYIEIPVIGVELPIYHGVGNDALSRGVGHVPQSSLPTGGENTHCVLSAHTGMAAQPMFSDLELLEVGDTFTLIILGNTLTYRVCAIQTVLPEDVTAIQIRQGEDLCTLVTCTPFGVNSHRLLVTGERITIPEAAEETAPTEAVPETPRASVWEQNYRRSAGISLGVLAVGLMIAAIIVYRRRRHETE